MSDQLIPYDQRDLTDPKVLAEVIAEINAAERGLAYKPPRMIVTLQKTAFVVNQRGSDEAVATYPELDGVHIMAATMTRAYYATKEQKVPSCSSRDGMVHGTLIQAEGLPTLPIPDGQPCAVCPFAQFDGSVDEKGDTKGTPCKERRNLLITHPDWEDPLVLSLARSSAPEWDGYAAKMVSMKKGGYISQITRIGIRQESRKRNAVEKYGIATFLSVGKASPDDLARAIKFRTMFLSWLGTVQPEPKSEASHAEGFEQANEEDVSPQGEMPF